MPQEKKGTHNRLYIDQYVFKDVKTKRNNVAMVWINYKKAYDIVLQTWIIEYLKISKISDKIIDLIMEN